MREKISIAVIIGSLRKDSYNRMLFNAAQKLIDPSEAVLKEVNISNLPLFNQDLENDLLHPVVELKDEIKEADAVLFITPEYNYSIPGVLKNAIDWASRPHGDNSWSEKPVAIMGASIGGFGTLRAQLHLREIFLFLNVNAVTSPEVYVSKVQEQFNESGELINEQTAEKIEDLLNALIIKTRQLKALEVV